MTKQLDALKLLACSIVALLLAGSWADNADAAKFGRFRFGRALRHHVVDKYCTGVTGQTYAVTISYSGSSTTVSDTWTFNDNGSISSDFSLNSSSYKAKKAFKATVEYSGGVVLTIKGVATCTGTYFHAIGHIEDSSGSTQRVIVTGVSSGSSSSYGGRSSSRY